MEHFLTRIGNGIVKNKWKVFSSLFASGYLALKLNYEAWCVSTAHLEMRPLRHEPKALRFQGSSPLKV